MTTSLVVGKIIVFLLLATGMYFLIKGIREYEILDKVKNKVDDLDRQRIMEQEQKSFLQKYLAKVDEHLTQAGVKKYLSKLIMII